MGSSVLCCVSTRSKSKQIRSLCLMIIVFPLILGCDALIATDSLTLTPTTIPTPTLITTPTPNPAPIDQECTFSIRPGEISGCGVWPIRGPGRLDVRIELVQGSITWSLGGNPCVRSSITQTELSLSCQIEKLGPSDARVFFRSSGSAHGSIFLSYLPSEPKEG
jgi:hypothetical protein